MQLDIFNNLNCEHCKKDPGPKPGNTNIWNGFFDMDTQQYSCHKCKDSHYSKKAAALKLKNGMLYSEFPVSFHQIMQAL